MPARKKSKLAPDENALVSQLTKNNISGEIQDIPMSGVSNTESVDITVPPVQDAVSNLSQPQRNSWYQGASWLAKASPVAQVARESISVEQGVSSESSVAEGSRRRPSQSVSKTFKGSRKSVPLAAEETRIHATSDIRSKNTPSKAKSESDEKPKGIDQFNQDEGIPGQQVEESPPPPRLDRLEDQQNVEREAPDNTKLKTQSGTWFGWWSRPDGYGDAEEKAKKAKVEPEHNKTNETNAVEAPSAADHEQLNVMTSGNAEEQTGRVAEPSAKATPVIDASSSSRSWFGLWSTSQNQQAIAHHQPEKEPETHPTSSANMGLASEDKATPLENSSSVKSEEGKSHNVPPKSSGWAFWSRSKPGEIGDGTGDEPKQVGELAVADTPSQSHPEAAQFNEQREERKKESTTRTNTKKGSSLSRIKIDRSDATKTSSEETLAVKASSESQFQTPKDTPEASPAPPNRGKKPQKSHPNLILPAVRETYPAASSPGYIERITQYVAQSLHLPGAMPTPYLPHPYISNSPPKIKKAVAIGIHGFFPAPLIQKFLGQPTGTSIRFANQAASSIEQWCQDHQPDVQGVDIEKVALEGEGYIADRVSILWKLLLNWLSHLRQADVILVACHSQGVPVAIMLVAKLIQLGCLASHVRLGICAMAGINIGPFAEYKSRLFGGTALELFDFCDSKTKVSIAYADAIDICLRNGVRMTFVGSLDDQLVSLESSLHTPLSHPYVSRAVFIDGRLHTPNFLTHLVVFAVRLRNLGVSDHGLIREVSTPLAGSLVGGEGHSRIYDDLAVYRAAVEFALESTDVEPPKLVANTPLPAQEQDKGIEAENLRRASISAHPAAMAAANSRRAGSFSSLNVHMPGVAPVIAPYEAPGSANAVERNPFVLPWAVRGMLAEDLVRSDTKMQEEVKILVREFESWKPSSKVLKDVRWRLEGIRSMA